VKKIDVLVVDDEADICFTLSTLLESDGFQVLTAMDAGSAEALCLGHEFSLILCDISMPVRTGLELLARLRQMSVGSAVVMLTAHSEKEKIIEALRLGAVDYVTKPFQPEELLRRVVGWTELGRRLQELKQVSSSERASAADQAHFERRLRMIELFRLKNNRDAKEIS
jgi:DNA-binding response OmpR family regulator